VKCEVCGSEFKARSGAKYCSAACRQKAYRQRVTDRDAGRKDVLRHLGSGASVTRDGCRRIGGLPPEAKKALRRHKGPLVSVVVGFVKGEGMTVT
jgi:hypothetical protein